MKTGVFRWLLASALLGSCGPGDGPQYFSVAEVFHTAPRCDAQNGKHVVQPDAPPPAGPRPGEPGAKVVLISIDGLRPDAIFRAPAPTLQALACRGAYSWQARTIAFSYTLPSHASMVSGFLPEAHHLLHNDFRPGYIAVPTVMTAARGAGKRVVLVVGKEKMIQLVPPGDYDVFVWTADRDADVVAKAVEEVRDGFDLLFVHLPEIDLVGHAVGWMSHAYLAQVGRTDAALAPLLEALPPEATVIVSADHGGSGYIHWSGLAEDLHIPWMVSGPGIRAARPLESAINTLDTAATAAQVLGLTLPPGAMGNPIAEPWTP